MQIRQIENNKTFSPTKVTNRNRKGRAWNIECIVEPVVQVLDEITITLQPPKKKQQVTRKATNLI